MSRGLLAVIGLAYLCVSVQSATEKRYGEAVMYLGFAIGNAGMCLSS